MYILGFTNIKRIPKSSEIISVAGGREGSLGKSNWAKSSFTMAGCGYTVLSTDNPKNHD